MNTNRKNIDFTECNCGNSKYLIYRDFGNRKVLECSKCGLLRSYPLPLKSVCDDNYQTVNDIQKLHSHQLYVLKKVMNLTKDTDSKILDIGCSSGNMIDYLSRKGYSNVCGIEMNDCAINICREKKLDVRKMNIEDLEIDDKFDIVYMNHVLEHVENLKGFTNQLKNILKDKAFVVIAVPNIGGIGTIKPDWIGYQFEQHYWHFTPESLSSLFYENGFKVISKNTLSGGRIKSFCYNLFNIKGDSLVSVFSYEE